MNTQLSDEQKDVLFKKATEPAFSGALLKEKRTGSYICANCSTILFSSKTKFDSGSGWPSFSQPANTQNVVLQTDTTHGMVRTEVSCAKCGGHLGHVFDDGPSEKGGLRYCVNSLSLGFEPSSDRE